MSTEIMVGIGVALYAFKVAFEFFEKHQAKLRAAEKRAAIAAASNGKHGPWEESTPTRTDPMISSLMDLATSIKRSNELTERGINLTERCVGLLVEMKTDHVVQGKALERIELSINAMKN